MPYVTKTRKVKRSWLDRLFSLSPFKAYREEEYEHWEKPEPLPVRSTAAFPKPVAPASKLKMENNVVVAPAPKGMSKTVVPETQPVTSHTYPFIVDEPEVVPDLVGLWASARATAPNDGGINEAFEPKPASSSWGDYKVYGNDYTPSSSSSSDSSSSSGSSYDSGSSSDSSSSSSSSWD